MDLTSRPTLVRSTLWSLLGQTLPVLAALAAIPLLISGLGIERFGILSLLWVVMGYFALFDLGLGTAVTRIASEDLAAGREEVLPSLLWTSLAFKACLGIVAAIGLWLLAPVLIRVLRIPATLVSDALAAFRILALTLPFVTGTAALGGVLAARQRFDLLQGIRASVQALSYLGPVAILPLSRSLTAIAAVLAIVRVLGWVAHAAACARCVPGFPGRPALRRERLRPLLRFGGWMTVSATLGPIMVYADRFLIAAVVSISIVAFYTTPYDLVTRLWLVSTPIVGVLFPAFAAEHARDRSRLASLYGWGLAAVFAVLFPPAVAIATLAEPGLRAWLGPVFAERSTRVLQLLACGVLVNGLAQVSIAVIQGSDRPDIPARLHALELPLYLLALVWLVRTYGIEGAAIAWVLRAVIDALVLFVVAARLTRIPPRVQWRQATVLLLALGSVAGGMLIRGVGAQFLYVATILVVGGLAAISTWRASARAPSMSGIQP